MMPSHLKSAVICHSGQALFEVLELYAIIANLLFKTCCIEFHTRRSEKKHEKNRVMAIITDHFFSKVTGSHTDIKLV